MSEHPHPPAPSDRMRRSDRRFPSSGIIVVAIVAALALVVGVIGFSVVTLLGATSTHQREPTTSVPDPTGAPAGLERFYSQQLQWRDCNRAECTVLTVPIDYADPAGDVVRIAVIRIPAQDQAARLGSLVVNPGGPGGSGVQYAAGGSLAFGTALSARYDIVGFDPRGVGQSDPLRCLSTAEMDRLIGADPEPRTPAAVDAMDQAHRSFGQACLDNGGALARHVSTVEAAKDMDVLRAALGETALDYLGASYGTFLGATYAELFPGRVGRFVLDGAVDPSLSNEETTLAQARGFETALRAYLQHILDRGDRFLGDTVDEAADRVHRLILDLADHPLPTGTDRDLTGGWAQVGIWLPLYVDSYWPQLTAALKEVINERRGTQLLRLGDMYVQRGVSGYPSNLFDALYAVNCLDRGDAIPSSEVPSRFEAFEEASPTFGRSFAWSLATCDVWPVTGEQAPAVLRAEGAAPILVLGTTRDPATPLEWAEALADQLDSGVLVVRDGDGHTAFQQGNRCVDEAVEQYLIDGDVPANGLRC